MGSTLLKPIEDLRYSVNQNVIPIDAYFKRDNSCKQYTVSYSTSLLSGTEADYGQFIRTEAFPVCIDSNGEVKVLKETLFLDIYFLDDDQIHLIYSPLFNIFGTGEKIGDAIKDFFDTALVIYRDLLGSKSEELTKYTKQEFTKMKQVFGSID